MSSLEKGTQHEIEKEDEAGLHAITVSTSFALPFVLHAANELDLFDIIAKAGHGACISPREIVSHLPTNNPDASSAVDRLLQLLAAHSMVTCSTNILADGHVERLYGLSAAGKFFVKDENRFSLAQTLALSFHRKYIAAWCNIKDAVLGGGVPIQNVTGMSLFELIRTDPEFGELFNMSMAAHSATIVKRLLRKYKGFEGFRSIVDVGGGHGATLNMIVSEYPSITAINFDLPNVIDTAPCYEGIEHVGGDMFLEVPRGEGIVMKYILHNWSDDKCVKLLKNCYKALLANGKVIIMDHILAKVPQIDNDGKCATHLDSIMFTMVGGKERTEEEFKTLARRAGFSKFGVVCHAFAISIMELTK
ncbi:uncharacterized protein LOC128071344 [Budorcas taxicolor]|uniref:uncharacterized protein LOC128071344 n=1 Tax=Budorcas taxicolor TaxID=37181 RepID=UPI0022844AFD|nr:uncharacterized protein LOC128071344 [Budorcas taxicolor]